MLTVVRPSGGVGWCRRVGTCADSVVTDVTPPMTNTANLETSLTKVDIANVRRCDLSRSGFRGIGGYDEAETMRRRHAAPD